ncbi:Saposin family type B, region 1 protein [Acanthamoeba castellanii str. Neff]|uniref:Saposin family type B, region 1 protein n=1 Tax=Acanthamoeba castellanii (strain ATCC 30010 / Neff) TaxID=1257118 RepID=L8GRD4_ACACF|nr:Saposin family type B, region 1 protein [Acanthamoeba castellanii str. Neff]ELR15714.1 Saposin family type B, region 1 protein [Acanthamoeba castellanii str. Neff]
MKFTTWMMISVAVVLAFSAHLCPICEFGCQAIGGLLAQNFTTTEIVLALEMICALAPEPLATTCHQFLSNTLPVLFQAISSGKTAEQACELVGACPSSSAVIINLLSKTARINN